MCGICGIYDRDHPEINEDILLRMRDVMIPRGPDDAGLHTSPHIGLGHRRLSILDISSAGHQPMANEDGAVWITFNGEIYNFRALRGALIGKGHIFRSFTDTEVLVHGYEEWGMEGLLRKINGMYAFALWDRAAEELILARDRLGVKPLFYMEREGKVYFSSDIKSIYLASEKDLTLDLCAMDDFLYSCCIPQQRSIFREVRKVQPAHFVSFRRRGSSARRYWDLRFTPKLKMDGNECLRELENRLFSAVRARMISDVPIGAFLSGGVDSSLVVALMAVMSGSPVKTFSMGVREESYNELKYARMVADRYSTDHHEFIVEPDALGVLPGIIWAYGEPFADASQIPSYYISRLTREHVTVALTGDGGDESFCGYGNSAAYYYAGRYRKYVPGFLRNGLLPSVAGILVSAAGRRGAAGKLKTLTEYGRGSFRDTLGMGGIFGAGLRDGIYDAGFRQRLNGHNPVDIFEECIADADWSEDQSAGRPDEVDKCLYIGIKTALPNDYLTKVDVATMMNSLEARSPYLDYELMEFAARLPSNVKMRRGRQKGLLKELAARYVPRSAVYRKKWGFGIPVGVWFKRGDMSDLLHDVLLGERAARRGYFNMDRLRGLITEHLAGKADHACRLWAMLCLELWHLMFIDKILSKSDKLI
ncbi:MAG: asparagine synthase (glutamine-hydrolyzing) [Nitrospiraceae bacterium]|nr:asparagine synthase (glutamine-hydrolyzing) [Nitrospiraceae bacterium]